MSLKDLKIKEFYSTDIDSEREKLLQQFIVPCLRKSVKYDRISAFYSSYILIYQFLGLKELVKIMEKFG